MNSWRDVAIGVVDLDWQRLLSPWDWLLQGRKVIPLAMSSFGDWFLQASDGTIHFLDLVAGELRPVADSVTDFETKASLQKNLDDWFMSELVLLLRERGVQLKSGECYGYVIPPILGGKIDAGNINPTFHMVQQTMQAQTHQQTRDLPPGTRITGFDLEWK